MQVNELVIEEVAFTSDGGRRTRVFSGTPKRLGLDKGRPLVDLSFGRCIFA